MPQSTALAPTPGTSDMDHRTFFQIKRRWRSSCFASTKRRNSPVNMTAQPRCTRRYPGSSELGDAFRLLLPGRAPVICRLT